MKKSLVTGAIGGGAAVVIATVLLLTFHGPTSQYSLYVDARTESGDGMSESHLTILNSGSSQLTNVKATYDGGQIDKIPVLNPGDRVILSPPTTSKAVTVTDDQGVTVTKSFSQSSE
ncbi:MAG: hypothetical protein KGH81_07445 [Thaumarchaeota archaeon]|nr:hypothetical protein [Nitrososphaerota archaeon]MDE1826961.1 hypothetical protein [Nitrososphaerota archaeon]